MKKVAIVLALFAVLVLSVQAFAATTVTFIQFGPTPERRAGLEQAIKLFEAEHPNIKVVIQNEPWGSGQQKLYTALASGNPPDGVVNMGDWLGQFVAMGALEPLDNYIKDWKDADRVLPTFWGIAKQMGHIYGVPAYASTQVLYYNRDLFEKAGLKAAPDDYKEFLQYAQKLTVDTNGDGQTDQWGYGMIGKNFQIPSFFMMMWDKDADYVKEVNGKRVVALNTPKTIEGLTFYTDLLRKYKVAPPTSVADDFTAVRPNFVGGKVAMLMRYSFDRAFFRDQMGDKVGTALMIKGPERRYTWLAPYLGVMFKGAKHKKEAWEFLKFMAVGKGHDVMCKTTNFLPLDKTFVKQYRQDPDQKVFYETLEDIARPQPFYPEWGACYQPHIDIMDKVLLGQITPEQGVKEAAAALQREIDRIYR